MHRRVYRAIRGVSAADDYQIATPLVRRAPPPSGAIIQTYALHRGGGRAFKHGADRCKPQGKPCSFRPASLVMHPAMAKELRQMYCCRSLTPAGSPIGEIGK